MAEELLNSTENIFIPHGISFWFQDGFLGDYKELGDLIVDGVSLAPEFLDFRSYRNGLNAVRKRLLTAKNAEIAMTLNEPNIVNLQRTLFGGAINSSQSITVLEGRHLKVTSDALGDYVDLVDASETDFANITVVGLYNTTDVTLETNLISANLTPDTDGKVFIDGTDTGLSNGTTVYVCYEVTVSSMRSTEIYGASDTVIEGAARMQARNQQGGIVQIWDLSSVHLAPNGDLAYGLDAIQTVPLLATLQERSGTFGTIYTK